ncbi:MAG TPA: ATP-binding domain-containing protein, partial [Polyangiaceae bacterium]|nr:ATP-binding domain-containing protein [Polyangiaceae bacterium]
IVDEASMIDVALMADLLEATPSAARVVLVGDADQLPSVGPGAVLHDLIASAVVPVSRLEVIFRQSEQSGIVRNSHRILHGEEPIGATEADGDFFIVSCSTPEKAASVVTELVTTRIPRRFGLDPLRQVQVLTPMHRGAVGTQALNARFQELLNAEGRGLSVGEGQLRMGDKVMQRKNDYDKEVFNGDLGEVIGCDVFAGSLTVAFDAEEGTRNVVYQRAELSQLSLAYAMTIHKSQGSEYPAVVVPMLSQHYVMLSRNLLYTAVTRAKRLCVLVVDSRALALALSETRKEERTTGLAQRLRAELAPSAAPSAAP